MVQIKLSVAFVLAAAAIAPVIAQPLGEGGRPHHEDRRPGGGFDREFGGRSYRAPGSEFGVGRHGRHESRGGFPHQDHQDQEGLGAAGGFLHHHHEERLAPDVNTPSRREYVDEFDARDLLGEKGLLTEEVNALKNQDLSLRRTHKALLGEDGSLKHTDEHLLHEEHHLRHADHRLGEEDGRLRHERHSLEDKDDSLRGEEHHLKHVDGGLNRERKTLLRKNKALDGKLDGKQRLLRKNKAVTAKGELLGNGVADKNKLSKIKSQIGSKGKPLASKPLIGKENVVPKEGDVHAHGPAVHSTVTAKLAAREFDDMFERDLENAESVDKPMQHHIGGSPPLRRRPLQPRFPLYPHNRLRPFLGVGPVIINRHPRPSYGPGPVLLHHGPASPEVAAREYTGSEDMFERDLKNTELDARESYDELYLD